MTPPGPNRTPEQAARDIIDRRLGEAGWAVQDKGETDFSAGPGVALREYLTDRGPADYVLFAGDGADGVAAPTPLGVIEAKPENWGHRLTTVEEQAAGYAESPLKWIENGEPLPFVYESTGAIVRFTDNRDPEPRSREVFGFHRPETLCEWFGARSLRSRLAAPPPLPAANLRDCQRAAIVDLEKSLAGAKPRALIQMATGAGKTFTAIASVYRLLKFAGARRVLFLVDTVNLAEQAEQEFLSWSPPDDNRKFAELYRVQRLQSSSVPLDGHVCIGTIQRMHAILRGEDLDEAAEERPSAEIRGLTGKQFPVVYSPRVPPEHFDFVVIDECHRSIYNVWRRVVEYFDAFLIGLTATPDARTYGFFRKNVVSEYTHERAVADGVNVGNEIYLIETERTAKGVTVEAAPLVERREIHTRKTRWAAQEADETFPPEQLDRSVVVPDQIRTVVRAFKENLPRIFPNRDEVPKTLIFAKTDSHADDVIRIVREEFDKGNAFCKKVTYRGERDPDSGASEDPKSVLAQFRNDYDPRIAVTVNMIATGTDVKPLECLLFMRDVRSANYFEQMKGRGTRVLDPDELRAVTPSARAKTHYVIVDAVGVSKSIKTGSRPLDAKPSVPLKDLATAVMMGARDADTVVSLAARLARLDRRLDDAARARIARKVGAPLNRIAADLMDAVDPDAVERAAAAEAEAAPKSPDKPPDETPPEPPEPQALDAARDRLIARAVRVFTGPAIDLIDSIRRQTEQIVDRESLDSVTKAEWAGETDANAQALVRDFADYLRENRDRVEALTIFFNHPARRARVTHAMIRDALERLRTDRPRLAPARVWGAYAHLDGYRGKTPESDLTMLVSLIRRAAGLDDALTATADRVRKNFQDWIMRRHSGAGEKFNAEQMEWLHMIRDHLEASFHIARDDLDMTPFDARGGLGRMHDLFGGEVDAVLAEMNEAMAA